MDRSSASLVVRFGDFVDEARPSRERKRLRSSRMRIAGIASLLVVGGAQWTSVAGAQVTLAQDTLSAESPAAALCGFCGGEGFGVVFRELPPPSRGLLPEDFPLVVRAVEVALASARLDGMRCVSAPEGGTAHVDIEIWAGRTPPGERIGASEPGLPWPETGEELVFAAADVPVEFSIPATGSTGFQLRLNRFAVMDEMGAPIRVSEEFRYLRVFVRLSDSALPGPSCPFSADGSPLRDDGRIANERSYILANGMGFVWNEQVRVDGDWAVRLHIDPALPAQRDAGPRNDAGLALPNDASDAAEAHIDAAPGADPGTTGAPTSCACRARRCEARDTRWFFASCLLVVLAALRSRRIRHRRT